MQRLQQIKIKLFFAAQAGKLFSHRLDGVVDFGLGGETADAEADRGIGPLAPHAHSHQHVGRLNRGRITGRACRYGEIAQRLDKLLAADSGEAEVEISRDPPCPVAVQADPLDARGDAFEQTVAQCCETLIIAFHLGLGDGAGLAETDTARRRHGA